MSSLSGPLRTLFDELSDHGEIGREHLLAVTPEQRGKCAENLSDGQVAITGAHEASLHRVHLAGSPQAALLAEHDPLGVPRPGGAE